MYFSKREPSFFYFQFIPLICCVNVLRGIRRNWGCTLLGECKTTCFMFFSIRTFGEVSFRGGTFERQLPARKQTKYARKFSLFLQLLKDSQLLYSSAAHFCNAFVSVRSHFPHAVLSFLEKGYVFLQFQSRTVVFFSLTCPALSAVFWLLFLRIFAVRVNFLERYRL